MRLDVYLAEKGYTTSRTEARKYIEVGAVKVDGEIIEKPSFNIGENISSVEVNNSWFKYVGRGGIKLEWAMKQFGVIPLGKYCIDIGASSGGFTDCLLQSGASHVIAVDSGSGQLVEKIASDKRVTSIEKYNARYMKKEDFEYIPDFAVMDVSFISATYIIKPLYDTISSGSDFICLIKPQFEVGKSFIGKGGIVKDERARQSAIERVIDFAKSCGFEYHGHIESPIKGGDGNIEYLAHFLKP